jgi:cell division septation protein DedD
MVECPSALARRGFHALQGVQSFILVYNYAATQNTAPMPRITQAAFITLSLAGLLLAVLRPVIYAQLPPPEVSIEATILEVDVAQLNTVQLPQLDGVLLPPMARDPGGFALVIPEMLGRSLAMSPGAKILQNPKVQARPGRTAEFRLSSRSLLPDSQTYGGIDFDVTPNLTQAGELLMLWVTVRLKIVGDKAASPAFTSRGVVRQVELSPGQSALLGGFVAPQELAELAGMKNVDKIPIFSSFIHAEGQERSGRELVILLRGEFTRPPTAKREPPTPPPVNTTPPPVNATPPPVIATTSNATPPNVLPVPPRALKPPAPAPAEPNRQTPAQAQPPQSSSPEFSVQIGAFANQKSAEDIATALKRQFPDAFVDALMGDRVLYRVRIGRFPNAAAARQLVQKLQAAGFDTMIVRRD